MKLEELRHKSIVLFGKPRALNEAEFDRLLNIAGIERVPRWDTSVAAVVEGRLVDPVAQQELDALYETHGILPVDINIFEKALCSQLEPERIMMSLKLTRDRERLGAFLQNPHIDDAFFLKLLSLYDWRNEGFFDNDENRDVTAAFIKRFYDNIERNHNIQYATMGLLHLLHRSDSEAVVQTLGRLAPVRHAVHTEDRQMRSVLEALAAHPATDDTTLKLFVRQGDEALRAIVAARSGLNETLQKELYESDSDTVREALARNATLGGGLADIFADDERFAPVLYRHIALDEARFEAAITAHTVSLAANTTLTPAMQRRLAEYGDTQVLAALAANEALAVADTLAESTDETVRRALASNPALSETLLHRLAGEHCCDDALAANPATPEEVLASLFRNGDESTLLALSGNESTPIGILQQLQLDARFERTVKMNEAFSAHIKREQIGWL